MLNEDETEGLKLGGVGFARALAGASSEFQFAYDEVLVVTRGRCSVESQGRTLRARVGEVIYLPAGVPGRFIAEVDVELVYVASSPYGEANRRINAELLEAARLRAEVHSTS